MITDRNARSVSIEYFFDETGKKTVLIVETDLQLDPLEIDFQPEQVEALCRDLEQHRQSTTYVDAVRLVRRRVMPRSKAAEITGTFGAAALNGPLKAT